MVGSLGENSIAGVALANQFSFLYQITCCGGHEPIFDGKLYTEKVFNAISIAKPVGRPRKDEK